MDTKTTLLNIGLELFSRSPYEAVGVQDIVEKAHVTKPTLYHHFGSKLGFYQAVFDHFAGPFFTLMYDKMPYDRDLPHTLNQISTAALEFFNDNREVYWLLEYAMNDISESEPHEFTHAYWKKLNQALEALFDAAAQHHGNIANKVTLSSWMFMYAIRAQVSAVLLGKIPYTSDLPYKMVHQFMYGIFA